MGVGSGLYMYDVVVKRSGSLSHLLTSSCKLKRLPAVDTSHVDLLGGVVVVFINRK